jgi:hypothetical protein
MTLTSGGAKERKGFSDEELKTEQGFDPITCLKEYSSQ